MKNKQNDEKVKSGKQRITNKMWKKYDNMLHKSYRPLTPWNHFWRIVLYTIPVIGWIFLLAHAIADKSRHGRSYARSYFCALLISVIITVVAFLLGAI